MKVSVFNQVPLQEVDFESGDITVSRLSKIKEKAHVTANNPLGLKQLHQRETIFSITHPTNGKGLRSLTLEGSAKSAICIAFNFPVYLLAGEE